MTVGITSALIGGADSDFDLNYETQSLIREFRSRGDELIQIKPQEVAVLLERSAERPRIWVADRDISGLDVLIVRGTTGYSPLIFMLVHALAAAGTAIQDPLERFNLAGASKVGTSIRRFAAGTGTTTWLFGPESNWRGILSAATSADVFPLLMKPARGRQGRGIRLLSTLDEADRALSESRQGASNNLEPLLVQQYIPFEREWRVVVVNGRGLGAARKVGDPDAIVRNAAQGSVFVADEVPEVISYVERAYPDTGILGVDVALAPDGSLHIIEANRAPQWREFERATGINVPREIASECDRSVEAG